MSAIFRKLNLKDQAEIVVLNAPETFEPELALLENVAVRRDLEVPREAVFVLAFVTKQEEVDTLAKEIAKRAKGDALVWFAYPKGSSRRFRSQLNRDSGWTALGELGFEAVRQVAIDEDWSAVRFRRVEYIRTMTRDRKRAMTERGRGIAGD